MPRILILNLGTLHALSEDPAGPRPLSKSVWRCAWLANEGDIIITPIALEHDLLRYAGDTLGFDAASVTVICIDELLTDDVLLRPDVIDQVRQRVDTPASWSLMPCFWTAGVVELAAQAEVADPARWIFAAQGGCDLLNRKSRFRQIAGGAGLPLPSGSVAATRRQLCEAIEKQLDVTGTVIVKRDDGAGGRGNITLTTGCVTPLPGSRETRRVGVDLPALAFGLWDDLTDAWNHVVVVESYHHAVDRFYLEYLIDDAGTPRLLNTGTIRLRLDEDPDATELVWVGLELPAAVPQPKLDAARRMAAHFASLAASMGYRGHMNIDAITTARGEILFNEVNGRWGGGLVLYEVAERLLGARCMNDHVVASLRDVSSPRRAEAVRRLREEGLHFDGETGEGAIVLACDETGDDTMECVVLARSRIHARQIESQLRSAVGQAQRQEQLVR